MKNEFKQLQIITNKLTKALEIVDTQINRYEKLRSEQCEYNWTCTEDGHNDKIAIGLLGAQGNIECALEHLYAK